MMSHQITPSSKAKSYANINTLNQAVKNIDLTFVVYTDPDTQRLYPIFIGHDLSRDQMNETVKAAKMHFTVAAHHLQHKLKLLEMASE